MGYEYEIAEQKKISSSTPQVITWTKLQDALTRAQSGTKTVSGVPVFDFGHPPVSSPAELFLDFQRPKLNRHLAIQGNARMTNTRVLVVVGPCVVRVNLSAVAGDGNKTAEGEAIVFLANNATLINTSKQPLEKTNIHYFVGAGCYLNFIHYPRGMHIDSRYVSLGAASRAFVRERGPECIDDLLREESSRLADCLEKFIYPHHHLYLGAGPGIDPSEYLLRNGNLDQWMGIPKTQAVGLSNLEKRREEARRPFDYHLLFDCRKLPEKLRFKTSDDEDFLLSDTDLDLKAEGLIGCRFACYGADGISLVKGYPICDTRDEMVGWIRANIPETRYVKRGKVPQWMDQTFDFQVVLTRTGKKMIVCREHDFRTKK